MDPWLDARTRKPVLAPPEGMGYFVYCIENKTKRRFYIGKARFYDKRRYPPLKGRKRIRLVKIESKWRDYTGSSEALNKDIEAGDRIVRRIYHYCQTASQAAYVEAYEQVRLGVVLSPKYYNEVLNVRLKGNEPLAQYMVGFEPAIPNRGQSRFDQS